MSKSEAEGVFHSLKNIYPKYQAAFDRLALIREDRPDKYRVIEDEIGPRISDSRVMVYDVLDYHLVPKVK